MPAPLGGVLHELRELAILRKPGGPAGLLRVFAQFDGEPRLAHSGTAGDAPQGYGLVRSEPCLQGRPFGLSPYEGGRAEIDAEQLEFGFRLSLACVFCGPD